MIKESGINITKAAFLRLLKAVLNIIPQQGACGISSIPVCLSLSHGRYLSAHRLFKGRYPHCGRDECMDRMSWVTVSEQDLYDGTMEQDVIDGVRDIINRLEEKPKLRFDFSKLCSPFCRL